MDPETIEAFQGLISFLALTALAIPVASTLIGIRKLTDINQHNQQLREENRKLKHKLRKIKQERKIERKIQRAKAFRDPLTQEIEDEYAKSIQFEHHEQPAQEKAL